MQISIQVFESMEGEKYVGIADCHGIESFIPFHEGKKKLMELKLRAISNRQRQAVVYIVALNKLLAKQIERYLDEKNYERALIMLKAAPVIYFLEDYGNSWDLIPNPKLDPWRK